MARVKLNNVAMNLLQNVRPDIHPARWPVESQERALDRLSGPWRDCLRRCHGLQAVTVGSSLILPARGRGDDGCRIPNHALLTADTALPPWPDMPVIRADWRHWPVRPGSLDMVILPLDVTHLAHLSALVGEIATALGPDAWLLVMTQAGLLDRWCRYGMPLAARRHLALREAHWGDARKLSLLPPAWSHYWSAQWQNLLPGTAQWTVQLWQKETLCPVSPERRGGRRPATAWSGAWAPQPRAGASHIKNPVKDCA